MHARGPWSEDRVREYLDHGVVPLRLACADSSGWPVVLSPWYVFDDAALWCATSWDFSHRMREPLAETSWRAAR